MKPERTKESSMDPRAVRAPARAPRWVVPLMKLGLALADIALTCSRSPGAFIYATRETS